MQQVWFAGNAIGAGRLKDLRNWRDEVIKAGTRYGYYMNETKPWKIHKHENKLVQAQTIFKETNINFTTEGKRYLGAALGSKKFCDEYASCKVVSNWCDELDRLSEIAKPQSQAT